MYDPFRIQFLTVSLDSEVVLLIVGVCVAWLVAREAARSHGRTLTELLDATVDVAFWAIVGARFGWVATHLDYYGRAPLQVAAAGDGGFLYGTGILTAIWLLWRRRASLELSWGELGTTAVPAIMVALLLDRAGCALTACGAGQPTDAPWALVRSGASFHPIGVYGMTIWLTAWLALRGRVAVSVPNRAWLMLLTALVLERGVAWGLGHEGLDGLVVSSALLAALGLFGLRDRVGWLAKRTRQLPV